MVSCQNNTQCNRSFFFKECDRIMRGKSGFEKLCASRIIFNIKNETTPDSRRPSVVNHVVRFCECIIECVILSRSAPACQPPHFSKSPPNLFISPRFSKSTPNFHVNPPPFRSTTILTRYFHKDVAECYFASELFLVGRLVDSYQAHPSFSNTQVSIIMTRHFWI